MFTRHAAWLAHSGEQRAVTQRHSSRPVRVVGRRRGRIVEQFDVVCSVPKGQNGANAKQIFCEIYDEAIPEIINPQSTPFKSWQHLL